LGLDLQVGLLGAAGTTQQAYTSGIAIRHSDLNVALWGGLTATFGGGAKMLFIGNATTVPSTAPTGGGLMYVTGGQLHFVSSAGVDYALTPTGGGGGITGGGTAGTIPVYSGATAIGNSVLTSAAGLIAPTADNTVALGTNALRFTDLFLSTTVRVGTNPSATGGVRLANNTAIKARNAANSADFNVVNVNGTNQLAIGDSGFARMFLASSGFIEIDSTGVVPSAAGAGSIGAAGNQWGHLFLNGVSSLSIDTGTVTPGSGVLTLTNGPAGKSGNPIYVQILVDGVSKVIAAW
jgi:hypothetical protein